MECNVKDRLNSPPKSTSSKPSQSSAFIQNPLATEYTRLAKLKNKYSEITPTYNSLRSQVYTFYNNPQTDSSSAASKEHKKLVQRCQRYQQRYFSYQTAISRLERQIAEQENQLSAHSPKPS